MKRFFILFLVFFVTISGCRSFELQSSQTDDQKSEETVVVPPERPKYIIAWNQEEGNLFGYIRNIEQTDTQILFTIDPAEWYSGMEAQRVSFELGDCSKFDECAPNGFYIHSNDFRLVSQPNVEYIIEFASEPMQGESVYNNVLLIDTGNPDISEMMSISDFVKIFSEEFTKNGANSSFNYRPFFFNIRGGGVIQMSEQYVP